MKNTHTFKLYPNLFKVIKVLKTIPVGTVTVERSFSAVNRLLRWARNSLSVLLASDLMLLSMNKDMLWSINLDKVLDCWVNEKSSVVAFNYDALTALGVRVSMLETLFLLQARSSDLKNF